MALSSKRPNILVFISDHLSPLVMGGYGDTCGATPAMDGLAENGTLFSRAYTACPLCQPSRAAFWTGCFPHTTNVLSNGGIGASAFSEEPVGEEITTLGELFSGAGYDAVHFGKCHDMGTLRGFKIAEQEAIETENEEECWPLNHDSWRDVDTVQKTVQYLENPPQSPFLAVCDLQNPHNICGWVGENQGVHEDRPLPEGIELPPLPDNFDIADWESRPVPVQYICCTHNRLQQASHWNEENYRHYLAAYYYYTRRVDRDIARVLKALHSTGAGENTLIVLMADHGDGLARHRMVTKQVSMYDETTRVPFILSGPGIPEGGAIRDELVSLLDLLPTLCDYADIEAPSGLWGKSMLPVLQGAKIHDYVASEWHTEWGYTISPGRMIRTEKFKYVHYREGDGEELYDMESDSGETRNLRNEPGYASVLEEHRRRLQRHTQDTDDDYSRLHVVAARRYRSHAPGYPNHTGPTAPQVGRAENLTLS